MVMVEQSRVDFEKAHAEFNQAKVVGKIPSEAYREA